MQLKLDNIEKIKKISSNSHTEVYLVNKTNKKAHKQQSKLLIAKYYLDFKCTDANIQKLVKKFINICIIYHPALNKYYGHGPFDEENDPKLIIFSEYSPNGPLSRYITPSNDDPAPEDLDDTQKLIITYGIASAIQFLHNKKIVHGNLKSEDVYLDENLNPKVSGYCSSLVPFTESPIYMAPEIIRNRQYSKESDVYAFGIVIYELFTNKKPFEHLKTPGQIFQNVLNGKRPDFDSSINPDIIKLIKSCWNQSPSKRPTFENIVNELDSNPNFMKGIDKNRFLDYANLIKKVVQSKTQKVTEKVPENPSNKPKQKQAKRGQQNQNQKQEPIKNSPPKVDLIKIPISMIKPQPKLIEKGEIHFNTNSDFNNFQSTNWLVGHTYEIEFFPTVMTTVTLLNASSDITSYVDLMKQDPVIFLDLEYVMPYKQAPPVCLFQFCCSSGAFLFKQSSLEVNPQLRDFLSIDSGCKFIGKGVSGDIQRLVEMYGDDFKIDLEDVENTRLLPYGDTANFDKMVLKYAGEPCAQFKDKKVSRSNWYRNKLTMKQVIYSAFDVVSLYNCYPNFQPIRHFQYIIPSDCERPSNIDIKKEFSKFVKTSKKCQGNKSEIENLWNSQPQLVAEMLDLDLNVISFIVLNCLKVMQGHKIACKLCKKSAKYYFTCNLIDHCLKSHKDCIHCNKNIVDLKNLFLDYFFRTGRVILEGNKCLLCDECFNSNSELESHCWNNHFDLLNEFLKKNKIQKNEKHKSDDDDDENENDIIEIDDDDDENENDIIEIDDDDDDDIIEIDDDDDDDIDDDDDNDDDDFV